ncbi:unnamed protein product [Protopolystoma xenopodis]|uniref:Uncharacterized protein n=1 Tax=Protopolystoma xenopodis TaxID=117903 RepID=A0A448WH68_9PLAT|nr:unnamed protein product [Protopolystoma xenopodis]
MASCSNDVHHMMDESSAMFRRDGRAVLRGPLHITLHLQLQGKPHTASGEDNLWIPSTSLFKRNGLFSNIIPI